MLANGRCEEVMQTTSQPGPREGISSPTLSSFPQVGLDAGEHSQRQHSKSWRSLRIKGLGSLANLIERSFFLPSTACYLGMVRVREICLYWNWYPTISPPHTLCRCYMRRYMWTFHSSIQMKYAFSIHSFLDQIQTFPPNGPKIPVYSDGCSGTISKKDFTLVLYLILST